MAAIPIYIVGTITTKAPKGGEVSGSGIEQCVIHGLASIEGLSVGGGPVYPPAGGGGPPPGIWPSPGPLPHPEHPIVIPPPPTDPPQPPSEGKPPPPGGGWGWHPEYGWGYFPGQGGKPQPPG